MSGRFYRARGWDDLTWKVRLDFGVGFAVTDHRAHAMVTGIVDTPPLEELIEELAREHPEGYALLSEFIDLKRYRDPRVLGE